MFEECDKFIIEIQQYKEKLKVLREKLQIAVLALEDISQYGIDDCPYCEEKILRAIDALERIKK